MSRAGVRSRLGEETSVMSRAGVRSRLGDETCVMSRAGVRSRLGDETCVCPGQVRGPDKEMRPVYVQGKCEAQTRG